MTFLEGSSFDIRDHVECVEGFTLKMNCSPSARGITEEGIFRQQKRKIKGPERMGANAEASRHVAIRRSDQSVIDR